MIHYLLLIPLTSFVVCVCFPFSYTRAKRKAIESCTELQNDKEEITSFPIFALGLFSLVGLVFYLSSDIILLIFSGLLAIAAYTDVCKRWIPDLIIYLLVIVSVYSLHTKDVFTSLIAMAFYMAPVVILSLYGYIVKKETWIASGDYYVFPSIGLLLSPEYAAVIMLITLFFMLFFMQWVKQIPLVTVAYFTFTGFNVCSLLGFL